MPIPDPPPNDAISPRSATSSRSQVTTSEAMNIELVDLPLDLRLCIARAYVSISGQWGSPLVLDRVLEAIRLTLEEQAEVQSAPLAPEDWDTLHESTFQIKKKIVTNLLATALVDGLYDARIRTSLRRLADKLGVQWKTVATAEKVLAVSLLKKLDQDDTVSDMMDLEADLDKASDKWRWLKIGGGAVVGAGILVATGILAAPLLVPLVGFFFSGLAGITGIIGIPILTAAVGTIGIVLVTTMTVATIVVLFGAAGAGLTAYKMAERTGGVEEFKFVRVWDGDSTHAKMASNSKDDSIPNKWTVMDFGRRIMAMHNMKTLAATRERKPVILALDNRTSLTLHRVHYGWLDDSPGEWLFKPASIITPQQSSVFCALRVTSWGFEQGMMGYALYRNDCFDVLYIFQSYRIEPDRGSVIVGKPGSLDDKDMYDGYYVGEEGSIIYYVPDLDSDTDTPVDPMEKSLDITDQPDHELEKPLKNADNIHKPSNEPDNAPGNTKGEVPSTYLPQCEGAGVVGYQLAHIHNEEGFQILIINTSFLKSEDPENEMEPSLVVPALETHSTLQSITVDIEAQRKVVVGLVNQSPSPLQFQFSKLQSGQWSPIFQPPIMVPSGYTACMCAQEKGLWKGVEGIAVYRNEHVAVCCVFSNPYLPGYGSHALIRGPDEFQDPDITLKEALEAIHKEPGTVTFDNYQVTYGGEECQIFILCPTMNEEEALGQAQTEEMSGETTGLHVTIGISGWLYHMNPSVNREEVPSALWEPVLRSNPCGSEFADKYYLSWDPQVQFDLGGLWCDDAPGLKDMAVDYAKQKTRDTMVLGAAAGVGAGIGTAVAAPVVAATSAFSIPYYALKGASAGVGNPFIIALNRAQKAGSLLGDALLNNYHGQRPCTLIAFSVGCNIVFECLLRLAAEGRREIVETVIFLGATVCIDPILWRSALDVVAYRFINIYSTEGWLSNTLFQLSALSIDATAGTIKVAGVPGLENIDATHLVKDNRDWAYKMDEILSLIPSLPDSQSTSVTDATPGRVLPKHCYSYHLHQMASHMRAQSLTMAIKNNTTDTLTLREQCFEDGDWDFMAPPAIPSQHAGLMGVLGKGLGNIRGGVSGALVYEGPHCCICVVFEFSLTASEPIVQLHLGQTGQFPLAKQGKGLIDALKDNVLMQTTKPLMTSERKFVASHRMEGSDLKVVTIKLKESHAINTTEEKSLAASKGLNRDVDPATKPKAQSSRFCGCQDGDGNSSDEEEGNKNKASNVVIKIKNTTQIDLQLVAPTKALSKFTASLLHELPEVICAKETWTANVKQSKEDVQIGLYFEASTSSTLGKYVVGMGMHIEGDHPNPPIKGHVKVFEKGPSINEEEYNSLLSETTKIGMTFCPSMVYNIEPQQQEESEIGRWRHGPLKRGAVSGQVFTFHAYPMSIVQEVGTQSLSLEEQVMVRSGSDVGMARSGSDVGMVRSTSNLGSNSSGSNQSSPLLKRSASAKSTTLDEPQSAPSPSPAP